MKEHSFQPAHQTAEDLPPNDECPRDLKPEQWDLIDMLATPPDLRDLFWTKSDDREKVDSMAAWCRKNQVPTQTVSKWHTNQWFRHYLALVKEQRATHDHMTAAMLEAMYTLGQKDLRAARSYLDYVKDFGEPAQRPMPGDPIEAGNVAPSEMTDEQLDALLNGPEAD